jgi:tRNA(Ile)-lysidine synthase
MTRRDRAADGRESEPIKPGASSPRPPQIVADLRRHVAAALQRSHLSGVHLIVAVSGGQDSLALLHALHALRDEFALQLTCAHFDHGLRGDASVADADFVQRLCESYGVDCELAAADPDVSLATEEAARNARYAFLASVADRVDTDAVVLGHTATDQAETVLLNVMRGTGLTGLAAMRPDSRRAIGDSTLRLIRPLLAVSRAETLAYCQAVDLVPRLDVSNDSDEFTRNRVRSSLVPLMRTFNPRVEDALVRLADNAAQALDLVEAEADAAWGGSVTEDAGSVAINADAGSLPGPVLAALVRRAITKLRGDLVDVRQTHIDDVMALLTSNAGLRVDLPGALRASSRPQGVVIQRSGDVTFTVISGEYGVDVPGELQLPGWTFSAELVGTDGPGLAAQAEPDGLTALLDPALAEAPLWVRGWLPGDRIQPMGMAGTKKVQDLFVDEKVPRQERGSIPLLVSERGIMWVVGHRIAEQAKLPANAKLALRVRAQRRV